MIAPGAHADLVAVVGDPLADPAVLRHPALVSQRLAGQGKAEETDDDQQMQEHMALQEPAILLVRLVNVRMMEGSLVHGA